MNDIIDRMERHFSVAQPNGNHLQMRRGRFRDDMHLPAWRASRLYPTRKDVDIIGKLSPLQICLNTTMKVDLATGKFWEPSFPGARCKAEKNEKHLLKHVDAGVPLDHFITDLVTTIPTRRMIGILSLRKRCQEFAIQLGHGTNRKNYRLLAVKEQPSWWSGGRIGGEVAGRRITELQGAMTHEQFMEKMIGFNQMIGVRVGRGNRRPKQVDAAARAAVPTSTAVVVAPLTAPIPISLITFASTALTATIVGLNQKEEDMQEQQEDFDRDHGEYQPVIEYELIDEEEDEIWSDADAEYEEE